LACLRALPESLGTATISEIYFGICSNQAVLNAATDT
jgi:hypothetical protein